MRELELTISEMLKNGLRPEKIPMGGQACLECLGFRCGKLWLEGHKQLTNPFNPLLVLSPSWPFPQVVVGEKYNFLLIRDDALGKDDLYQFSADHTTVTLVKSYTWGVYGIGNRIELADFGEYAFLTNGVVMTYRDVVTNTWTTVVSTAKIPLMRTVCNFKGQAIGGGVVSNWHECDETYIIWSKIGEMDFTPDEKNTAGFRRDPWGGEVYHVRRLGDVVIAYTSKGLSALKPVMEPAPTFGLSELSDVGLINRGAVDGSIFRHLFVDAAYNLCELSNEGLKVLGYQEYMFRLAGADIIVSYDSFGKDFYISNGQLTFLYSSYGLTEVLQHPSAVWTSNGDQHMIPITTDLREPLIVSEQFDMGYRGHKNIFVIELGIVNYDSAQVAIDWKMDNTAYKTTSWLETNSQNIATQIIAGTEFRLRLKLDGVDENTLINYAKIRYKMTDLKSIRGIYAPPPRGQAI